MATMDQVVEAYLKLRAHRDTVVKRQKEELAPVQDQLNKLLAWTHGQLISQGQKNARVDSGTCFLQTDTSIVVEDWAQTIEFIKTTGQFELLEKRVSKGVVQEFIESTGTIPPGVKVTSDISCHIRKS